MGNNHFITVSRAGVLTARRKGEPPVQVATASEGLVVSPDGEAVSRGVPSSLRVLFAHGGANRELLVLAVVAESQQREVADFQARYGVTDDQLGRWMRAAVEAALDAAGPRVTAP